MKSPASLKPTLGCVLLLALAGCSSSRQQSPPPVLLLLPSRLPPECRANVWHPDELAPYAVGRYLDPSDRNVLHEAHTVYRRERASRPNLTPPTTTVIPPGQAAATSATNAALIFRDALAAELNQQRATSQAIIEQSQQLQQKVRAFNDSAQSLRDSADETARIRTQWQTLTSRLDRLERRVSEAEMHAPPAPPPSTSKWFRR